MMRASTLRSALAALLLSVAPGCDEPPAPTDGGHADAGAPDASAEDGGIEIPDRVPLEQYCELAPRFWCDWLDRCRRGCDAYFDGVGADRDGWCDAMAARVADGSVAYDPDRASACLRLAQAELDAACEEGEESRDALHGCVPFEGRRAPAERCVLPFPIESTCDPALGTCSALRFTDRCPGTCVAYLGEGDACDLTRPDAPECAPGLFCLGSACVAQPAEGEPCDEVPCADGLRCAFDGSASVCRAIRALGEPCTEPWDCEEGTGCSPAQMECVQTLARGDACRSSEECAAEDYCGLDGTCAERVAEGAPCLDAECAAGLMCAFDAVAAEERCQLRASDGEPCDPGVCGDGLFCQHDAGGHRCAAVGAIGADCGGEPAWTFRPRCEHGAFCNDAGTCEAQRGADEPCDSARVGTPECDVESGVICDPFTDSCLGPGDTVGARCLGACTAALYCDVDVCAARIAVGAPCPPGDTCVAGSICVDLDGTGARCWEQSSCQ